MSKTDSVKFINRIYVSLREYYMAGDEGGQTTPEEDFSKEGIMRMMQDIHDRRFLDQIRMLMRLHIQKKGGAA